MKINVIIRDYNNLITEIRELEYKKKKFNNLEELAKYLSDIHVPRFECDYKSYCCEYDIDCKKKYLYDLTKKTNKFSLDVDFDKVNFNEYLSLTKENVITINCVEYPDGIGSTSGFSILNLISSLFQIKDIICFIIDVLRILFVLVCPFWIIKRKYGYGKHFIYDIFDYDYEWDFGFFKLDKIKLNHLLEFIVMNKLGYKLKKKHWINVHKDFDPKKHLNKYNKF